MEDRGTALLRLLGDIKRTLEHLVESITTHQQSNQGKEKEEVDAEVRTEVRLPVEITKYYESEERERGKTNLRDKIRVSLEITGVIAAIVLAILTFCTLETFNGQLIEMRRTNKITQKQLEVSERPWITEDIEIGGDFTFESDGEAHFRGAINLRNVGHSPAIGIESTYSVVVPKGSDIFMEPMNKQKEICEPLRKRKTSPDEIPGITILFQGQQTGLLSFSTSVPKEWIDSGSFTFPGSPARYITPVLVGCVDYRFSFAPDDHHQTGFIYEIGRYKPTEPLHYFAIPVGTSLTAPNLKLFRHYFGGHYAD